MADSRVRCTAARMRNLEFFKVGLRYAGRAKHSVRTGLNEM
jgi:hypothetical protein